MGAVVVMVIMKTVTMTAVTTSVKLIVWNDSDHVDSDAAESGEEEREEGDEEGNMKRNVRGT